MLSEVAHKGADDCLTTSHEVEAHLSDKATSRSFYKAKALSGGAKTASSHEANAFGEAKLALLKAKQAAFIKQNPATAAKSKASQGVVQLKGVALQSPRVSVLDRLGPINSDLRDYLSNK